MSDARSSLAGRRVVITGAARGIGALTAQRLHDHGARLALLGLEPELLERSAAESGDAFWAECDVTDRAALVSGVESAVEALGGLDVAIANAGVGAQMPLVGGDPRIWDSTIDVNLNGAYNLVHAAGPHLSHRDGYLLLTASLAAAVHVPLMAPYVASKAAVEALGDSLRIEMRPSGAKVGVAYFAELDTDMTTRGFDTKAASEMPVGERGPMGVAPVEPAIEALLDGIAKRSRRVVYPPWARGPLALRPLIQRVMELRVRRALPRVLEIARDEQVELTTEQKR